MGATDDQLRVLGRLTTEFSFLELTVKQVILGLLHKDERDSGMILTAHLSFAHLCDAAAAIAHERMKNVPGAVEQLEHFETCENPCRGAKPSDPLHLGFLR